MILLTYISHILPCRLSYFSQYISHSNLLFKNNQPYFTDQTTTFYAQSIY